MSREENLKVARFIAGMQNLILGMQQVDNSCMEAFGSAVAKRDFGFLIKLGSVGKMIMREVAEFLQVPMSTATGIIDKLIECGFVERDYSKEDRRIVLIELSTEGKRIYDMLQEKLYEFGELILQDFSGKDKESFIGFIEKAVATAESEVEERAV
ncbi:MAG: MarR family transcriptional regulator [Cyclobacteriaceae bacterium]|nr:MarR family transcriptional regulator [Cyclobacteriaceae bacterium HetDA_MAG_MS6]